jgi:hypothetical protein
LRGGVTEVDKFLLQSALSGEHFSGWACSATSYILICSDADSSGVAFSNAVDLYNITAGAWSTAQLSFARWGLAATSVGKVAIFAGGQTASAQSVMGGGGVGGSWWLW